MKKEGKGRGRKGKEKEKEKIRYDTIRYEMLF